jgi:hypothetical protein
MNLLISPFEWILIGFHVCFEKFTCCSVGPNQHEMEDQQGQCESQKSQCNHQVNNAQHKEHKFGLLSYSTQYIHLSVPRLDDDRDLIRTDAQYSDEQEIDRYKVEHEVKVIPLSDTLAQPRTVMVKGLHTIVTFIAMGTSWGSEDLSINL